MNMTTKKDIFKEHLAEWLQAKGDRKKRGEMIKSISQIAKVHPNSVGRSFGKIQLISDDRPERRGRKTYYTKDVDAALYDVWQASSQACGELLFPVIGEYVNGFKKENRWKHCPEATAKLLIISVSTLKRRCRTLRNKYGINHGRSTTSPSSLKHLIPIFKGPWDNLEPGNGQIDTVAHCGDSLQGDFVYTVSFVDSATYWGVRRAQWNKGQLSTKDNLAVIKQKLPFKWLMAHPDTGSEFINWLSKDWCEQNGIKLTRSEPGKKNDNMYVEERNGHVVRKYLGWQRLDASPAIVEPVNDYFYCLDLYLNHFQAVRRTVSKERIGAKYKRVFEKTAMTPYQRLMRHESTQLEVKNKVKQEHENLNPLLLKEMLDKLKKKIFKFQKINSHN